MNFQSWKVKLGNENIHKSAPPFRKLAMESKIFTDLVDEALSITQVEIISDEDASNKVFLFEITAFHSIPISGIVFFF